VLQKTEFWRKLKRATDENAQFTPVELGLSNMVITATQRTYLKALGALQEGNLEKSADLFRSISPNNIPPAFLYPPYRLLKEYQPDSHNSYREGLLELTKNDLLPYLWAARVMTDEGRFMEALVFYWKTAPEDWTRHDTRCFRDIAQLQGTKPDVINLALKATSFSQIKDSVRTELNVLLESSQALSEKALQSLQDTLNAEVESGSATGLRIIASAKQALDLRKLYLSREYQTIVNQFKKKDPIYQSDETLMLVFTSAAQLKNIKSSLRWGREIQRRSKESETKKWVQTIINEARAKDTTSLSSHPAPVR
jgi:hypothetical protein